MKKSVLDEWTNAEVLVVAESQKQILWMILLNIIATLLALHAPSALFSYAPVVTGIITVYFIYKLAVALRSTAPWVYMILAFVPLVSLIALFFINSRATKRLEVHEIKVGLMGAKATDLEKLKTDAQQVDQLDSSSDDQTA